MCDNEHLQSIVEQMEEHVAAVSDEKEHAKRNEMEFFKSKASLEAHHEHERAGWESKHEELQSEIHELR